MSEPAYYKFTADYLKEYPTAVFKYFGVPNQDAMLASEVLSRADLRGIESLRNCWILYIESIGA